MIKYTINDLMNDAYNIPDVIEKRLAKNSEFDDLAMIALYPDAESAGRIRGFLDQSDAESTYDQYALHLTILFLGEANSLPENAVDIVERLLGDYMDTYLPIEATVTGQTVFGDDEAVTVLLMDAQGLSEMYVDTYRTLRPFGIYNESEHGFIPHMSVANGGSVFVPAGTKVNFDRVELVIGKEHYEICGVY